MSTAKPPVNVATYGPKSLLSDEAETRCVSYTSMPENQLSAGTDGGLTRLAERPAAQKSLWHNAFPSILGATVSNPLCL